MTTPEKPKRPRKPRAPIRRKPAAAVPRRPLTLYGSFPRQITSIRNASMMLVMAYGQTDEGEDVMVPLLDVQLYPINPNQDDGPSSDDADDLDETPVFTSVLTLENTAFLLNDMAGDVGRAVDLLAAQCGGSVKPDPERMRYSAQVLRKAASRLQATAELLDSRCIQDTHD